MGEDRGRKETRVAIKEEEGHTHQIYIQNRCGFPPPTLLRAQGSKPRPPSYIPRAPALHQDPAVKWWWWGGGGQALSFFSDPGVVSPSPGPSPLGTQESHLPVPAPSTIQAPTFECIWRRKITDRVGGEDGGGGRLSPNTQPFRKYSPKLGKKPWVSVPLRTKGKC